MVEEKKVHVLLIEDDQFLSDIYRQKFEMEGFRVTSVENAEAGITAVRKKKPDIVLLELLMPKVDGFTVLETLKEHKTTHHIPIILLTNLGQKEDVERGLAMGADDYLIKAHFKPSEIVDKVKHILNV
jgi:DNA-binding response OmpR family regulator